MDCKNGFAQSIRTRHVVLSAWSWAEGKRIIVKYFSRLCMEFDNMFFIYPYMKCSRLCMEFDSRIAHVSIVKYSSLHGDREIGFRMVVRTCMRLSRLHDAPHHSMPHAFIHGFFRHFWRVQQRHLQYLRTCLYFQMLIMFNSFSWTAIRGRRLNPYMKYSRLCMEVDQEVNITHFFLIVLVSAWSSRNRYCFVCMHIFLSRLCMELVSIECSMRSDMVSLGS